MKTMCKILFPEGTVGATMGRIIEMLFSDEPTIKKDVQKSEEDDSMIDILERGVPVKVLARVSNLLRIRQILHRLPIYIICMKKVVNSHCDCFVF
jgi:hypothetical protein